MGKTITGKKFAEIKKGSIFAVPFSGSSFKEMVW